MIDKRPLSLIEMLKNANPSYITGRDPFVFGMGEKDDKNVTVTIRLSRRDIARIVRALQRRER